MHPFAACLLVTSNAPGPLPSVWVDTPQMATAFSQTCMATSGTQWLAADDTTRAAAGNTHMTVGITKDVIVKDKESSVEYGTASMVNGKIQISALKEALAADKLSLKLVDGCLPEMDKDGWSVRALPEHTDVVVVTTAPKPGGT